MPPQMKAARLNCGEIRTLSVKYLIVACHFSLPLLPLVVAKRVNTEHQEDVLSFSFDIGTLASINGTFFTPLFSPSLNFFQLINFKTHSLLSSSHYQLNILLGEKK